MREKYRSLRARKRGKFQGIATFDFPVVVSQNWLDRDIQHDDVVVRVIAQDARDAAQLVWEEVAHKVKRPTQIEVIGVKGGTAAHRFIGYESMIGANFLAPRSNFRQLALPFNAQK